MGTTAIEKEVLELERKYWQAIKDGDVEVLARLSDDPCVVTGAQGVGQISREVLKGMFAGATWKLEGFEISNAIVRAVTDDVVAVAYKIHERLTVDGKPLTIDASDSSVWVRRGGAWVCAVHTEAIAGDPFGRDRGAK
jgi:ketosteroid isomerase-like protein